MRLQKYLARAGAASRRASEELILAGRVCVNGSVADELGTKVEEGDLVELDGERIQIPHGNVTIMLNKPVGYVTTMHDAHGRPTVADLVPVSDHPSLFPVGRLDMDTSGLLLFTTDGELGNRLLHPSFHVDKTYIADIDGRLGECELAALRGGVLLEDGMTAPADVRVLEEGNSGHAGHGTRVGRVGRGTRAHDGRKVQVTIHEGRKRQVRRMFEAVGRKVLRLHRTSFGSLHLGGLKSGKWRLLDDKEVAALDDAANKAER